MLQQGQETDDWWDVISSDCSEDGELPAIRHHIATDFVPFSPKLYRVGLGMGYLELPQVLFIYKFTFLLLLFFMNKLMTKR